MTLFVLSIFLGIVPMIVYALIVWRLDRWEKEPLPILIAAFLWGSIPAVIFSIIAQTVLGLPVAGEREPSLFAQLYQMSVVAPVTEEILKGLGLLIVFYHFRRLINSVLDGLVYGSMIGFGFAAVENVLYFWGQPDAASLFFLFFLRAFVFGMLHALFTGLLGVGLAMGKFAKSPGLKIFWPLLGLGLSIGTHALHNYFATIGGDHLVFAVIGVSIGILWFLITVIICLHHENRWIKIHLAEEVENGVLYAEQALDTADFWARSSLSGFSKGFGTVRARRRLLHEATLLAYEKQRREHFGTSEEGDRHIAEHRENVRHLSREDPLVIAGVIKAGKRLPPPLPPLRRTPPPLPS